MTQIWNHRAQDNRSLYFVRCDTPEPMVKVGYASSVPARLSQLQNASPLPLMLLTSFTLLELDEITGTPIEELEQMFHTAFAADHVRGEWFRLTPALQAIIDGIVHWRKGECGCKLSDDDEDAECDYDPLRWWNLLLTQLDRVNGQ